MSSVYPVWWDSTITIYNKFEDEVTNVVKWYRTVLSNCFWKYVGDSISQDLTRINAYDTICRIPENSNFLPNYQWQQLSSEEKHSYFTVGLDDIIILGETTDNVDEYTQGERSSEILEKYKRLQGCILVKEFAIDVGPGRCCPHYRIYGI